MQGEKTRISDPIVKILADKHKKTVRYVRYVRDGERENEQIFTDYMNLKEGFSMVAAVVKAVPFESPKQQKAS